jgi:hypothetical protein
VALLQRTSNVYTGLNNDSMQEEDLKASDKIVETVERKMRYSV